MIGYWLIQELHNAGIPQHAVCLLSRTVVAPGNPAFDHTSKFLGASYDKDQA